MTGRAVVPTLAAPAAENQPLGQFQGASSESRVNHALPPNGTTPLPPPLRQKEPTLEMIR